MQIRDEQGGGGFWEMAPLAHLITMGFSSNIAMLSQAQSEPLSLQGLSWGGGRC